MTESKFSIGDVVSLNSGGPKMTVRFISPDGKTVRAYWFNEAQNLDSGDFIAEILTLIVKVK